MKFNRRLALIILFVLLSGSFLLFKKGLIFSQTSETQTIKPQYRQVAKTLELSGSVKAKREANLHFQTGGLVVYYPWQEGDYIKKYQTIASLDQRQLQKTLRQKLNLYAKQRHSFDQTQDDYRKNIEDGDIDQELKRLLENAQYDLDNAVLDVEIQDLALKYAHLYSPIDGILVKSPITTPHVNILATDTFTVVDPTSLYFSAELEEGDLAQVSEGMPATVILDSFSDAPMEGKVERIAFTAKETSTGTVYPLEISLPQDQLTHLRLNLNGTAYLVLEKKDNVLSLPQEAIHQDDHGTYVYLLKNGQKQKQSLQVGLEGNEFVEIVSGLSPEDQVVLED